MYGLESLGEKGHGMNDLTNFRPGSVCFRGFMFNDQLAIALVFFFYLKCEGVGAYPVAHTCAAGHSL